MQDIYYVQPNARRLLKCLHQKDYTNRPVNARYLNGLDEGQFWDAFGALRDIFEDFFVQAVERPEKISMPLYRLDEHDWKSKEAKAGHTALLSFFIIFLALAAASRWEGNALTVTFTQFNEAVKKMKGSKKAEQIRRLYDYGFTFSEWDGKKFSAKCETFTLDYPDNPNVLAVVAAIGDKFAQYRQAQEERQEKILNSHSYLGNIEQFAQFDPNIYTTDSGVLPSKTLAHMMNTVGEANEKLLCAIVEKFKERGMEIHYGVSFIKNDFYDKRSKDTLNNIGFGHYSIGVRENEPLALRIKLIRPSQYIEKIDALPPHLMERFEKVKCFNCSDRCTRKIKYVLNNKNKIACACETFVFVNINMDDLDMLMNLYDAEQLAKASK